MVIIHLTNKSINEKRDFIHGESFPDGVMFNNNRYLSIAYKDKNGVIKDKVFKKDSMLQKHPYLNYLIIIRGLINFFEGSINQLITRNQIYKGKKGKINKFSAIVSVIWILLNGFILYFLIPTAIAMFLKRYDFTFNTLYGIEALSRIILFLVVFVSLNLTTNAKKTSYFHGAEHKTLLCHMSGEKITQENVKKYPIYNQYCGTSLIFIFLLISIPAFYFLNYENIIFRILIMLILLPILLGLSFDIIDWIGRSGIKKDKIMKSRGFILQRLNTREPGEEQLKISILALTM